LSDLHHPPRTHVALYVPGFDRRKRLLGRLLWLAGSDVARSRLLR
jgi:hypothetical protein